MAALTGRESNEIRRELFRELKEIAILPRSDSGQLRVVSADQKISHLLGLLRRAVKASGGATGLVRRPGPANFVAREWDAFKAGSSGFGRSAGFV